MKSTRHPLCRRRLLLGMLPFGLAFGLTSCTVDHWTGQPEEESDGPSGPRTPEDALGLAQLAPAPDGAEVRLVERETGSDLERWACEVVLTAASETIDAWLGQCYEDDGLPAPAHVTTTEAKEAFGIGDVPESWRYENVSLSGVPYERMVLIDDQDPKTVRVHLVEVQD